MTSRYQEPLSRRKTANLKAAKDKGEHEAIADTGGGYHQPCGALPIHMNVDAQSVAPVPITFMRPLRTF
jgi:hypothetical protein